MYEIVQFGDLIIPPYLTAGDAQDIGTGAALSSFLPLPGGGFYDNYQDGTAPQGIRPINKSGVFLAPYRPGIAADWGTPTQLRQQLDAWRALLGKRAKLVVRYDDGALRWQWARLQNVTTPRGVEVKGGYLPFSLTWITAAQNWRGAVRADWTWGDGSWEMGDGTAYMGVGSYSYDLLGVGATFNVPYEGSIDCGNLRLHFTTADPWEDLTVINQTTGQTIFINRASSVARPWVEIDSGARSMYLALAPARTIAAIYREMNRVWVVTSGAHGIPAHAIHELSGGTPFRIEGSGVYDGTYFPAITDYAELATVQTNKFYFLVPGDFAGWAGVGGGQMTQLLSLYDYATISDRKRWLTLAPGDNAIQVSFTTSSPTPIMAQLTLEFTDHHA